MRVVVETSPDRWLTGTVVGYEADGAVLVCLDGEGARVDTWHPTRVTQEQPMTTVTEILAQPAAVEAVARITAMLANGLPLDDLQVVEVIDELGEYVAEELVKSAI